MQPKGPPSGVMGTRGTREGQHVGRVAHQGPDDAGSILTVWDDPVRHAELEVGNGHR